MFVGGCEQSGRDPENRSKHPSYKSKKKSLRFLRPHQVSPVTFNCCISLMISNVLGFTGSTHKSSTDSLTPNSDSSDRALGLAVGDSVIPERNTGRSQRKTAAENDARDHHVSSVMAEAVEVVTFSSHGARTGMCRQQTHIAVVWVSARSGGN